MTTNYEYIKQMTIEELANWLTLYQIFVLNQAKNIYKTSENINFDAFQMLKLNKSYLQEENEI